MIRQYSYRMLMRMLTSDKVFVLCSGKDESERFFFAQIVD
jgi:hypothetical protein